jgi:hypothetical protein
MLFSAASVFGEVVGADVARAGGAFISRAGGAALKAPPDLDLDLVLVLLRPPDKVSVNVVDVIEGIEGVEGVSTSIPDSSPPYS